RKVDDDPDSEADRQPWQQTSGGSVSSKPPLERFTRAADEARVGQPRDAARTRNVPGPNATPALRHRRRLQLDRLHATTGWTGLPPGPGAEPPDFSSGRLGVAVAQADGAVEHRLSRCAVLVAGEIAKPLELHGRFPIVRGERRLDPRIGQHFERVRIEVVGEV